MAAPLTCFVLLLVAVSCTTIQWSKPIPTADKRLSTVSEDWVPVASACPTCPEETESKVVARQAASLLQPPPAYQPSAQSAYIEQTLSAQQREIQDHFNTQGLLPAFIQKPQQFYNQQSVPNQQYLPQTGTLNQQLVPPQLSHQLPSAAQRVVSPQLSHQQTSAAQQIVSPHLSHQQTPTAQQVVNPQLSHQQISAAQQVLSPQLSNQQTSAAQQVVSPQLSHQQISAVQQVLSPQLSHQQTPAAQQVVSPQLKHQQISAAQQVLSPQLNHQQTPAAQHVVSPQLSHQQAPTTQLSTSATQLSHEQPSADQQLVSPQLSHERQKVSQRTRRPTPSTTTAPAPQEEVQLLYVPVETLRQQHQAALLRQQQKLTQELQNLKPKPTTVQPSSTLEPYQPPLSVYMGPKEGHNVKISDVVTVLKGAKTISVLDTVGPDSPQVFVGPSDLQTPSGYAKFELPYLSALESNRVERKVDKPPFFVAPLSFKPPAGYSKIPFPAPHVGSVVVANVTENYLHEKGDARKAYSLPSQLPPINPELPSLVNSLQDQRNVPLLTPQKQAVTNFLQTVQQVGLETSTERYTRNKQSRHPYHDTEVINKPERLPSKQTTHRFQQPPPQYPEAAVATVQPHYLDTVQRNPETPTHSAQPAEISTYQPPYPEHEERLQQSHYSITPEDNLTRQPQTVIRNPAWHPQYKQAATQEKEYTVSQEHISTKQTESPSPQESPELTSIYLNSEEESATRQPQNVASDATLPVKQAAYNVPPEELQYPRLESVVLTEPPKLIRPQENIPKSQTQYSVPEVYDQLKYTTIREEMQTRQPQYSQSYSEASKYTTPQYSIPERQAQHPTLESSARPSQYDTARDAALRQSKYSEPEEIAPGNRSKLTSQEDIPHRQRQYPVPENIKYTILEDDIPQFEPQYPVPGDETPEKVTKHHRAQKGISLRQKGGNEQIYTNSHDAISQHGSQYSASSTEIPQEQQKQNIPILQPQYQNTEAPVVTTQPNYANLQEEISSGVTQYTVSSDRFQSQHPFLGSQILTESVLTSTTTAASERATLSRGRSRGRYRPSSFSTTTPAPRTRTSHARGRRPASRTSSEAPQVPATAADQFNPFESSRQPSEKPQAHRFEAQRKDRTRSRSRGRSTTTTTTALPQYNSDLYQEEQYAPTTSTQHSRTDTATENLLHFISPHQQQAPSGQVSQTQLPNGQMDFTKRPSSEPPQRHSGQVTTNHFSTGQIPHTQISSGSNSDGLLIYTHDTNGQVSFNQIPNRQDALRQLPNRNEGQPHIPLGQADIIQTGNDEVGHFQLTSGQTHSQIQSGTLDDIQIHNKQTVQNHISSGQVGHGRISTGQGVNNQLPSGEARSNQILGGHVIDDQTHSRQAALPQIPDYYNGQSISSKGSKDLSFPVSALASTEAVPLQQDGFLLHELPEPIEETTQRQYSALQHSKHRTQHVSPAYQTTFPSPTLDEKFRGRGDSHIVTSDRSAQQLDGEVTQRPSLVRIRGRIRGRQRVIAQPVEQSAATTTVTPELHTTTVGRKHTNFLNRGSARKTQAPTTTPTAETTTPVNDKVYTVRPSRRPQQVQTKLTKTGRIRRPTRPPTTTAISTLTVTSEHRLNEVPDVFTTESFPTTRQFQPSLQPEYDLPQQYQPKQHYQSIQRHRESAEQYQPDQQHQSTQRHREPLEQYQPDQQHQSTQRHREPLEQYQPDQQHQSIQLHREPVEQYEPDQQHHSIQRHREPVGQYQPDKQHQSIQRHREPAEQYQPNQQYQPIQGHRENDQQYQPDQQYQTTRRQQESVQQYQPEKQYQSTPQNQVTVQQYQPDEQYLTVERLRVADQMSLPSDNQPQYEADDLERGEESQWSTRTLTLNSSNAIPNADKSSTTQVEVTTTDAPVTTEEAEIITETNVPTTEAAPLMLTAFPDMNTTTETSTPGHSRRRGNWVRVRVRPQQQQDIFETAESQNVATVAAVNQIPGKTIKQMTNSPGKQDVLENYSRTSSSTHGDSEDHATTKQMTESSSTQEVLGNQAFSFNFHSVPSGFMNDNATADSETESPNNHQNTSTKQEHPFNSATINGNYKNSDSIRKHVKLHSSVQGEILHKDSSGVTNPSGNGYFSDKMTTAKDKTKSLSTQSDPANADSPSNKAISSWLLPPSGLDDPWNKEDPSEAVTKPVNIQSDTVTTEETTTPQQDSYIGSLFSSPGYYSKPEQDSDKRLNWGGYEDWWAKTYANHRPYYTDEHFKLPEEAENLPDSTSIWNMDSFREYEGLEDPAYTGTATNTSKSNNTTEITESGTSVSPLEDHPSYQERDNFDKYHHSSKHSVKKANPQNRYNEKEVKIDDTKSEPEGGSIQVLLTETPEDISPGAVVPVTESPVETRQFSEPRTEESDQSLTESTTLAPPPHNLTTELSLFPVSTEFVTVNSSTENILSTEDETDKPSYSEINQTLSHTEYSTGPVSSTERGVPLASEPNIKRTDTQSLMTRILGTRTSTKISHETEICYRGRCIKTKTKDSDIDQFSTD